MWAIFKSEFLSFFSSIIGILVVLVFLVINGLLLWVFDSPFNIYNAAYADLNLFFELAPWVFMFLIPGICMKSFSEEQRKGTLELLFTKPISLNQLILGKFLGAFVLCLVAVLPTLIYIFSIQSLASETAQIDYGAIAASYFGLVFLIAVYTAIGIFSSTLSDNQLVAFIVSVLLCLLMFYGFFSLNNSSIFGNDIFVLEYLSLNSHYRSIMRGVIDTRDLVYFISIFILFLVLTKQRLKLLKT